MAFAVFIGRKIHAAVDAGVGGEGDPHMTARPVFFCVATRETGSHLCTSFGYDVALVVDWGGILNFV